MAAFGNKLGGKGYENTGNYKYTDIEFCAIENIHAVRDSYKKMKKLCNNNSTTYVYILIL